MNELPPHPLAAAQQLAVALAEGGITADVHHDFGAPLVSVWVGLIVCCADDTYWWRTGWNPRRHRPIYASHPFTQPARAAHRVTLRYTQLRMSHPLSSLIAGAQSCP
ncbi:MULTISPECIES: hypothetical protein [Nonomuraea]|uniref:Uncharacterized protein n=1 Tax=Nonomuraea ferruginea TaxID=46174 RepID=A0ABT4SQC9_9ACTN|nr:hypothetical protein [Nonomuraea ferruginea]MDA0639240.1 hypothetical protein [Nonomuraea ferruginea]